jgi:hypothetical protein
MKGKIQKNKRRNLRTAVSDTMVKIRQTIRRHLARVSNFYVRRENLKCSERAGGCFKIWFHQGVYKTVELADGIRYTR